MEETTVTIASLLSEAGTTLGSAIGVVWDIMTANPLLSLATGAGIVTLGFAFFRKAKRTARG